MALAFHNLLRKRSDQLSSSLGEVVKRYIDPKFKDKFQVKTMYTGQNLSEESFNYEYTAYSKGHQLQSI